MEKIIVTLLIILSTLITYSQKDSIAIKNNSHIKAFNQANQSGDIVSCIIALNYYMAEQGINTPYADTLAMLYMQQGAFPQSYYWVTKRLQTNPDDNTLLEMKGVCLDKMRRSKEELSEAVTIFEKLFNKTQKPEHAYQLIEMQYGLGRYAECILTASNAERLQYKPENTMTYRYTVGNGSERIARTPLLAAIYNLHGMALYQLDKSNKTEAKIYFQKAVALDSNFVLALQNITAIESLDKVNSKVNLKNPKNQVSPGNKNKN